MTVTEFKSAHKINSLNFYKSNNSNRLVASTFVNGKEVRIISRTDFDPAGKEKHIYKNNVLKDEDGVVVEDLYWLSNSSGEVALTL